MTEAYTTLRTDEAKKELAYLLQQQAEIEAIMSGGKTGENTQGMIRDEGNIMPEYREQQEADIAIGMQREIIQRTLSGIFSNPEWEKGYDPHAIKKNRDIPKKSITQIIEEVITDQMEQYYQLKTKKGIEGFVISSDGKQVSGRYLGTDFSIYLVGWMKYVIHFDEEIYDSLSQAFSVVHEEILHNLQLRVAYVVQKNGKSVSYYALPERFYGLFGYSGEGICVQAPGGFIFIPQSHFEKYTNGSLGLSESDYIAMISFQGPYSGDDYDEYNSIKEKHEQAKRAIENFIPGDIFFWRAYEYMRER